MNSQKIKNDDELTKPNLTKRQKANAYIRLKYRIHTNAHNE